MHRLFLFLVAVSVAIMVSLAPSESRAQDIESYFRRFDAAFAAENHLEAHRLATQIVAIAPTQVSQAEALLCLGRACRGLKRPEEAIKHYQRALTIPLASTNTNNGWITNSLGLAYMDIKKFEDAEAMLFRSLKFFGALKGTNSSDYATISGNIAELYNKQDRSAEAEPYAQRRYEINRAVFGDNHAKTGWAMFGLALISTRQEQFEKAESRYRASLTTLGNVLGPTHKDIATVLYYYGVCLRNQDKWKEAEVVDRKSLKMREQIFGPNHEKVKDCLESLASDLDGQEKKEEAIELRTRAAAIEAILAGANGKQGVLRVTSASAKVFDGANAIGTVKQGEELPFTDINGRHYLASVTIDGKIRSAWLLDADITILAFDSGIGAASAGIVYSPPRSRFKATFPTSPDLKTQVVNGVTNYAYTSGTENGSYIASFFDLPVDKGLTFDAAVGAFAASRQGTVQSQKAYELDFYPGREFVVALPRGMFCRMRLLTVNRRWYQLVVEGSAEAINDDTAKQFFDSFALVD